MSKAKIAKISCRYAVMTVLAFVFMLPYFYMFFMSFMGTAESVGFPKTVFFPTKWVFTNYKYALDRMFLRSLGNTMFLIAVNIVFVPLGSAFCAYGFARIKFPGNRFIFGVTLSTIMLPSIAVQIPSYSMFYQWGWINTYWPFVIGGFVGGGAANIFLVIQFMRTIPKTLDEAARIDGASHIRIFLQMIIPLCVPIIVFMMINIFNGFWNDFSGPLMFIRDDKKFTLPQAIYEKYKGSLSTSNYPSYQMATGVIMIIIPVITFFVFQKQIIDGVVMGSIKG